MIMESFGFITQNVPLKEISELKNKIHIFFFNDIKEMSLLWKTGKQKEINLLSFTNCTSD